MNEYKCIDCYFYKSGYMSNSCEYFEQENFNIQKECDAYTTDGNISPELEDKIFRESNGNFGKPLRGTNKMTEEKAYEILEEVKMLDDSMYQYYEPYLEALDVALDVLKKHIEEKQNKIE